MQGGAHYVARGCAVTRAEARGSDDFAARAERETLSCLFRANETSSGQRGDCHTGIKRGFTIAIGTGSPLSHRGPWRIIFHLAFVGLNNFLLQIRDAAADA